MNPHGRGRGNLWVLHEYATSERNNEVYNNNEYQFTDYCHIMSQQKGPEEAYPQGKSLVT